MSEIALQQRVYTPTLDQRKFLKELLSWHGAATPQEVGRTSASTRQTCKRRGWVKFDGYYWRITEAGNAALSLSNGKLGSEG